MQAVLPQGVFPFPPTDEQEEIIDKVVTDLTPVYVIKAFAGATKTTTLEMIAHAFNLIHGKARKIVYLAYNSSIKNEAAETFPSNTMVKTIHGLCWRYTKDHFGDRQDHHKMKDIAPKFVALSRLSTIEKLYGDIGGYLKGSYSVERVVLRTIERYQYSADYAINYSHVPKDTMGAMYIKFVQAREEADPDGERPDQADEYREFARVIGGRIVETAQDVWDEMVRKGSRLPIFHDTYVKWLAIQDPKFDFDTILVDEFQDSNPVTIKLIGDQDCQKVYVGDPHQQIYQFRGSINAMGQVDAEVGYLTTSFRFGQNIANFANRILDLMGESKAIRGGAPDPGRVGLNPDAKAVLCRTNMGCLLGAIESIANGYRTAVVGGTRDAARLLRDAYKLAVQPGYRPRHEALEIFDNWQEFVEFTGTDEGKQMAPIVKLILEMGNDIPEICDTLEHDVVQERYADRVFSTAHKAKGRQWTHVRLGDDFQPAVNIDMDGNVSVNYEEMRLQYVAATRAKVHLDPGPIASHLEVINRN